jgi:hypothetical protein
MWKAAASAARRGRAASTARRSRISYAVDPESHRLARERAGRGHATPSGASSWWRSDATRSRASSAARSPPLPSPAGGRVHLQRADRCSGAHRLGTRSRAPCARILRGQSPDHASRSSRGSHSRMGGGDRGASGSQARRLGHLPSGADRRRFWTRIADGAGRSRTGLRVVVSRAVAGGRRRRLRTQRASPRPPGRAGGCRTRSAPEVPLRPVPSLFAGWIASAARVVVPGWGPWRDPVPRGGWPGRDPRDAA